MLRRMLRILRVLLLGLGIVLCVWLPLSYVFSGWLTLPGAHSALIISSWDGLAQVYVRWDSPSRLSPSAGMGINTSYEQGFRPRTHPTWRHFEPGFLQPNTETYVFLPIWLLAAICLAWPVTSLLLALRRR